MRRNITAVCLRNLGTTFLTDSVGEFTSDVGVDAREGAPRAAAAPRRCPDELVVGPDFRHHRTAGIALTEINYEFS